MRYVIGFLLFLAAFALWSQNAVVRLGQSPKVTAVAIGSLPTCNGGSEGTFAAVTDALLPVALAVVSAGGAVHVPVYCNGTAWIVP